MPQCTACGLTVPTSACSRCKAAHYCSKTCQTSDWPVHKPFCKRDNYNIRFQVYPEHITNPPVWRTLSIPSDTTYLKLHNALQIAFGWTDTHSYEFVVNDPSYVPERDQTSLEQHIAKMAQIDALMGDTDKWQGDPTEPRQYLLRVKDDAPDLPGFNFRRDRKIDRIHLPNQVHPRTPVKNASATKLWHVLENAKYKGQPMTYIYDLGDFWRHRMTVTGTVSTTTTITCIDGEGSPIEEDCGSHAGWNRLVSKALRRGKNLTAWDREAVNEELAALV